MAGQWRQRLLRATIAKGFSKGFPEAYLGRSIEGRLRSQLLSNGLIIFSKLSNEVSPRTSVPLTKKVGVEFTLSVS